MDKYTGQLTASGDWVPFDPAFVAQSVHSDFEGLISVFDRLSAQSPENTEMHTTLEQARLTAERGLGLSRQLVELLRTSGPQ